MSARTKPPFRADHVGSLLRPAALLAAREQFSAGAITGDELRRAEDEAITEIVRVQEEIGLKSVTDGEFRRSSWHMDFIYQLGGITTGDDRIEVEFRDKDGSIFFSPAALHVTDRVTLDHTIFAEAFQYLQGQVTTATPKLTIPSPSMVHYRGGRAAIDPSVYTDIEEFWADLSAAYAEEIRRLGELGCTYLQLDDTSLAYLNDPQQRAMLARQGEDA